MTSLPGASEILAGSEAGKKAAAAFEEVLGSAVAASEIDPAQAPLIFLDFAGVKTAAASFLREFSAPFFGGTQKNGTLDPNLSPAFVGIGSSDLKAELNDFFSGRSLAVRYASRLDGNDQKLLGQLEKSVEDSFAKLQEHGPSTAAQFFEKFPESCSGQTTWNNRLMALCRLRLAARIRQGRTWIYQVHRWRNK